MSCLVLLMVWMIDSRRNIMAFVAPVLLMAASTTPLLTGCDV